VACVAAVVPEPIQGERGVHLPRPDICAVRNSAETAWRWSLINFRPLGHAGRMFACKRDAVLMSWCWERRWAWTVASLLAQGDVGPGFLRVSSNQRNLACRVSCRASRIDLAVCARAARKGEYLLRRLRQMAERPKSSRRCAARV
jgi:acetylornithine/succinyldiaminopimelate/putrescine aminotransferase